MCKTLKTEQHGAVSRIMEWIMKSLEGVELHQSADEKASSRAELLAALRFRDSRNKIDKSPPLYSCLDQIIGRLAFNCKWMV